MTIHPVVDDHHRTRTNRPWEAPVRALTPPKRLSLAAAADYLDVSEKRLRDLIKTGVLPAVKDGRRIYIRTTVLNEYDDNLPEA